MDKRFVVGIFAGFVALGVVYGVMAVVMGTPKQGPPTYSMTAPGGDEGAGTGTASAGADKADAGVGAGAQTGGGEATGTTGAYDSAGSTAGDSEEEEPPAPDQPARVGVPLKSIGNPPPGTLVMLEPSGATARSAYDVTFAPFGIGPEGGSQPQLVIKVLSSTLRGTAAKNFAFANTNVLANLASDSTDKVRKGGAYKAVLTLKEQDGLLVPELSRVTVVAVRK